MCGFGGGKVSAPKTVEYEEVKEPETEVSTEEKRKRASMGLSGNIKTESPLGILGTTPTVLKNRLGQ